MMLFCYVNVDICRLKRKRGIFFLKLWFILILEVNIENKF